MAGIREMQLILEASVGVIFVGITTDHRRLRRGRTSERARSLETARAHPTYIRIHAEAAHAESSPRGRPSHDRARAHPRDAVDAPRRRSVDIHQDAISNRARTWPVGVPAAVRRRRLL